MIFLIRQVNLPLPMTQSILILYSMCIYFLDQDKSQMATKDRAAAFTPYCILLVLQRLSLHIYGDLGSFDYALRVRGSNTPLVSENLCS